MKIICLFILSMIAFTLSPTKEAFAEQSHAVIPFPAKFCPQGYDTFYAFEKVIKSDAYKCYGQPSGHYKRYSCPNKRKGTCYGNYVKQEFCNNGKRVFLYHTEKKCTCGCVNKNFHGRNLNILDLSPCGCDDDLEEIIGVEY